MAAVRRKLGRWSRPRWPTRGRLPHQIMSLAAAQSIRLRRLLHRAVAVWRLATNYALHCTHGRRKRSSAQARATTASLGLERRSGVRGGREKNTLSLPSVKIAGIIPVKSDTEAFSLGGRPSALRFLRAAHHFFCSSSRPCPDAEGRASDFHSY